MIRLGEIQTLEVVKTTDFGVYLSTGIWSSIDKVLLPKNQVPEGTKLGDKFEVFIYRDSEDRLIATTTIPPLTLGGLALLTVCAVNNIGAFLHWNLAKDLLLPFKEQTYEVQKGDQVLVSLYIDKSGRLCATMKVYEYLKKDSPYKKDDMVTGIVYETSNEFGTFVAVDNQFSALIPKKECFESFKIGSVIEARVASVKEDGKLDLSTRKKVYEQMDSDAAVIYNALTAADGYLPFNDKSDAESIKKEFRLSKNAFKRAIGRLLKEGKIEFYESGIKKK